MKDILIINSLIKSEQEVITSYEKYMDKVVGQQSSMVEDSINRHNNHMEALKKLSEEVR